MNEIMKITTRNVAGPKITDEGIELFFKPAESCPYARPGDKIAIGWRYHHKNGKDYGSHIFLKDETEIQQATGLMLSQARGTIAAIGTENDLDLHPRT